MPREIYTNSDPSISEEAFEESAIMIDEDDAEVERDLATEEYYDTQHGDGHTYNPIQAQQQGLTYTPPDDAPVLPSEDLQDAEIAAGYSPSMEASSPDAESLPLAVDNNDLDLQDDVYTALRNNSETATLNNVSVRVDDGIVTLLGTVPGDDDIARVFDIVSDLDGVIEVRNRLTIEE
ncbi:MAG: BON domain-containing protein [Ardenticatenaceae bacterium]|nr:BON domain-containing protein [Ardenticatenaceae bacterium]HBY94589.1 hypothetical protein [Chloroflexota bacterium]